MVSASDNTSTSFDYGLGNAIVENPLVDAVNGLDAHADYDHISVSVLKNKEKSSLSYNSVYNYPEESENSATGTGAGAGHPTYHHRHPSRYPHWPHEG